MANSGPGRKWKVPVADSYTMLPVTSEGIRSGVNWIRRKSRERERPNALTSSVLATPGTPSRMTWPCTSRAASTPKTTGSWPLTALATSARTASNAWLRSATRVPFLPIVDVGAEPPRPLALRPGSLPQIHDPSTRRRSSSS